MVKGRNSRVLSVRITDSEYETIEGALPPGVSVSDWLKAAINEKLERLRSEENLKPGAERFPGTPRGAPCPCGSGNKYKRCCGVNSKAVIYGLAIYIHCPLQRREVEAASSCIVLSHYKRCVIGKVTVTINIKVQFIIERIIRSLAVQNNKPVTTTELHQSIDRFLTV